MTSFTSWMRLEPQCRNADMNAGLQARIYDPLWLLARQWQVGEFQGEDNGSPVKAKFQGETARFTRYAPSALAEGGSAKGQAYDGTRLPLETLVERERVRGDVDPTKKLRFAVEAGQHFLRILAAQQTATDYAALFKTRFAFTALTAAERESIDHASLSYLDLMLPRVPDGRALYAKLASAVRPEAPAKPALPAEIEVAAGDVAEVIAAAGAWLDWYEQFFSEPASAKEKEAWIPERMEYGFSLATRLSEGERVVSAREYLGGHLDWHDFSLNEGAALGAAADAANVAIEQTLIPTPVSYRGMPSRRFWAFEDAAVDFGALDAGPEDLARMLLVEFAVSYGNDWFVLPIELEVGSLCHSKSLVVTNTFGEEFLIRPSSESGERAAAFKMFELSAQHQPGTQISVTDPNLFMLAPSHWSTFESRPFEEVQLLRDEMANLAWGVERLVESAIEQPLNRYEQQVDAAEIPADPEGVQLTYRLSIEPPDYWVPLLPVKRSDGMRLKRGAVLKPDGTPRLVVAKGSVLNPHPNATLELFEEEVPREGARVTRSYQLARWHDGSTHLWIGRRKRIGRGEGSAGLAFDVLR